MQDGRISKKDAMKIAPQYVDRWNPKNIPWVMKEFGKLKVGDHVLTTDRRWLGPGTRFATGVVTTIDDATLLAQCDSDADVRIKVGERDWIISGELAVKIPDTALDYWADYKKNQQFRVLLSERGRGSKLTESLHVADCSELKQVLKERGISFGMLESETRYSDRSESDWLAVADLTEDHFAWLVADVRDEIRTFLKKGPTYVESYRA
jgi:hypothetical protein